MQGWSFFRAVTGREAPRFKKGHYHWLGEDRRVHDQHLGGVGESSRLLNYLSASFKLSVRPLRRERRLERNRAMLVGIWLVLGMYWVTYRILM